MVKNKIMIPRGKSAYNMSVEEITNIFGEILDNIESRDIREKYLREEIERIKSDTYKDSELALMKKKLEEARDDLHRGFGISAEEDKKITEWIKNHELKDHGITSGTCHGAAGGGYTYEFCPTGLGTIGIIKCNCGKEFTFQNLW